MSPHKREQDLASLSKIRGVKSVSQLALSKEAASLHVLALKQIKEIQGVSNPQNISIILPHILLQIGYEFLAERPKGMPSRQAARNLQVLIQQKIREKGSVLTSTTSKYLESCRKAESVKGATKEYFAYLLALASPIQEHELNKLWQIKTSKTLGKVGLATKALALCQAVIQEIRVVHKVKEPGKLSHILSHLLLRA